MTAAAPAAAPPARLFAEPAPGADDTSPSEAGSPARDRRRRIWRFAAGALAGAVLVASLVVAVGTGSGSADRPGAPATATTITVDPAEQAALAAYGEAVAELAEAGGAVVVYGMRPGLADIAEGAFDDDVLVTMGEGWVAEMNRIRTELAALDAPAFVTDVAARLDEAMAGYVETAEALLSAARAQDAERADLLDRASTLGTAADERYDAALEALAEAHARFDVPAHPKLGGS